MMGALMCLVCIVACKSQNDPAGATQGAAPSTRVAKEEHNAQNTGGATALPSARAVGAAGGESPAQPQRCLSEKEVDEYDILGWQLAGPMSVVRVSREDTLSLRQSASLDAAVVAQLAHDQSGIVPTRQVCLVATRPWYQVRVGALTGWVNSQYIRRTTTAHDRTAEYRKRFGSQSAETPSKLVKQLLHALNNPPQTEGKYQAEILDTQVHDDSATATLYACCELDDSVAGEQTLLTMKKGESSWRIEGAQTRYLCYRGLSNDGTLCN